jgi:hypothetical protein
MKAAIADSPGYRYLSAGKRNLVQPYDKYINYAIP